MDDRALERRAALLRRRPHGAQYPPCLMNNVNLMDCPLEDNCPLPGFCPLSETPPAAATTMAVQPEDSERVRNMDPAVAAAGFAKIPTFGQVPEDKWHGPGDTNVSDHRFEDVFARITLQDDIRYVPRNPDCPIDFRTVVIEGFSDEWTIFDVLDEVRGGAVFSANMMETASITGSRSAMITFVTFGGVRNFINLFNVGELPGLSQNVQHAEPLWIPSYPIDVTLQHRLFWNKVSRALLISNDMAEAVAFFLNAACPTELVMNIIEMDGDDSLFEFNSVKTADWARFVLLLMGMFDSEDEVPFWPDYCADFPVHS